MPGTDLQGKVVVVTGAGSGLGEASAHLFARAGASVACLDINGDEAERISGELARKGARSLGCRVDVSSEDEVFDAVEEVDIHFGRLDIVINSAAIDHTMSVNEMAVEQWDQVIAVNLRGPFLVAKAAFPIMQRQGYGHIVNIASTAAKRAWANAAAYHASKWGLIGFSRGLGVEGRPHGIRVTTVVPGGMRTHFFDRFADQGIPMPNVDDLQDPTNVAEVILSAVSMPPQSVVQEILVTPLTETSWP